MLPGESPGWSAREIACQQASASLAKCPAPRSGRPAFRVRL